MGHTVSAIDVGKMQLGEKILSKIRQGNLQKYVPQFTNFRSMQAVTWLLTKKGEPLTLWSVTLFSLFQQLARVILKADSLCITTLISLSLAAELRTTAEF